MHSGCGGLFYLLDGGISYSKSRSLHYRQEIDCCGVFQCQNSFQVESKVIKEMISTSRTQHHTVHSAMGLQRGSNEPTQYACYQPVSKTIIFHGRTMFVHPVLPIIAVFSWPAFYLMFGWEAKIPVDIMFGTNQSQTQKPN